MYSSPIGTINRERVAVHPAAAAAAAAGEGICAAGLAAPGVAPALRLQEDLSSVG